MTVAESEAELPFAALHALLRRCWTRSGASRPRGAESHCPSRPRTGRGLIPFTILGILIGHLVGSDVSAPAVAGVVTLFALLGGVYGFQIARSGVVLHVVRALPSYWLV